MPLHVHFRWGVTLVGKLSTGHCSPHRGTPLSGTKGLPGNETHPRPYRQRNGHTLPYFVFCKNLGSRPSFGDL